MMRNTIEWVREGVAVVELTGKLAGATAGRTEKLLVERAVGARHLVLDLSAVGYLSSTGLRVLLAAGERLRAARGRLILCAAPAYIKDVLDLSGFSSVFPV